MDQHNFIITAERSNLRVDKALSLLIPDISRTTIQRAIKASNVLLNNVVILDAKIMLKENDVIDITLSPPKKSEMIATSIEFEVIYEDDSLIIVNKPAGLTVHPGAGNYQNTLANGLMHHTQNLSDIGGMMRPGIVHRLDKDTSGLMVVAKNNIIHERLAQKIQDRSLIRKYKALIWGTMNPSSGIIEHNIARSRGDRTRMQVVESGGKTASTLYHTDQIFLHGKMSLVTCKLQTGRTHQIRVHFSHMGHSIVGDQTYGHNSRKISGITASIKDIAFAEALNNFKRQALHSYYLAFKHPLSNQFLEFEIGLPDDMRGLVDMLD